MLDFAAVRECLYWNASEDNRATVDEKMRDFYQGKSANAEGTSRRFFQQNKEEVEQLQRENPKLPKEFFDRIAEMFEMEKEFANETAPDKPMEITIYVAPSLGQARAKNRELNLQWLDPNARFHARDHAKITEQAAKGTLQSAGGPGVFSAAAVEVMKDASVDIDSYCWTHMPTHAQSSVGDSGIITTTPEAQQAWAQFVMHYVRLVGQQCKGSGADDTRNALYRLGFAMHALEDLAAHQGRTNEEHAFSTFVLLRDPDGTTGASQLGVAVAKRFLERAFASELKECIPRFASFQGKPIPSNDKGGVLGDGFKGKLNGKRDLNVLTGAAYVLSAFDYPALKRKNPRPNVRWLKTDKLPQSCDAAPCSDLLEMIFKSPEITNPGSYDHCLRK